MNITITLHTQQDPTPDLSYLGEFSNRPKNDESIPVPAGWIGYREWLGQGKMWYTPMNSIAESRAWFTQHGYSKHDAYTLSRDYAIRDMKRILDYYRDEWYMLDLGAVVTYNGADIGEDWLGGVESDSGDYLKELFDELITEAISRAESWLIDSGVRLPIDWGGVTLEKVSKL